MSAEEAIGRALVALLRGDGPTADLLEYRLASALGVPRSTVSAYREDSDPEPVRVQIEVWRS